MEGDIGNSDITLTEGEEKKMSDMLHEFFGFLQSIPKHSFLSFI
jgi:hypothetical protein